MKKKLYLLTAAVLLTAILCPRAQAVPVLESKSTAVGASSAIALPKPAGTQAGDLLIAALMLDRGSQIVVTSVPAGWSLVRRSNYRRYIGMATYCKVAENAEPENYSFGLDETAFWSAGISRISGADPKAPIHASSSKTGSRGSVTSASVTTTKENTLALAFFTNRRNATYTPDASTTEQYDEPNIAKGLPSAMLASFEKPTAGATGNKTAIPSRSDRQWAAQQVVIAGAAAVADLSGFTIAATGSPVAGTSFTLNITDAKNASGALLNGTAAVALDSTLDGRIIDSTAVFTNGETALPAVLTAAADHVLTAGIAGIASTRKLAVTVARRPVTVTANASQRKMKDAPDPAFIWTLTGGSLISGIPLSGELTRAPGEDPGMYPLQQGSLKDSANPNYAITFQSADFEITAPEEIPLIERGIWTSADEIAPLPMTGEAWRRLLRDADLDWGVPNISDQEDKVNVYTMAKALVYARTGIESYRQEVITLCMQAVGTEDGGRSLALGRNLAAFVIAAELVTLPPEQDVIFRGWLREVLTKNMSENRNLVTTHELRPNNWGTHAGGSRAAVAAYLQDWAELDRVATVFKGWLGDRTAYQGFVYAELDWQSDPANPVGINPVGATIQGFNVDGVLPDDQRRSGGFAWPPPKEDYVYEALQGALLQAVILDRAGYDVWNWGNRALLRSYIWLHNVADFPSAGDDNWQPYLINRFYGTTFPIPEASNPGKNVGWTCWTHQ